MPATMTQPPIPVPNKDNILQVLAALRNAAISASNTDAGRADNTGTVPALNRQLVMNTPSQFNVSSQVVVQVTYPVAGGTGPAASVTIPQLQSITWTNMITGETIVWTAPGKLFNGGTIGAAL